MLNNILIELFDRDLDKVKEELNAYANEADMWKVEKGISNSAGNLALHLIGNLNHFIGATLGHTNFVRKRDSEFTLKNIARAELINEIDKTKGVIRHTFARLGNEDFEKIYPLKVLNKESSTMFFMIHLATHLNYHLGQINYHRRLIGG